MTLPADPLHPLWATPIGVHQWAEAADANALLARAFSGMRATDPNAKAGALFYASADNLLNRIQIPEWQSLVRFIVDGLRQTVVLANQSAWPIAAPGMRIGIEGIWFQIANGGVHHDVHTHGNCSWSGVYCVQVDALPARESHPAFGLQNGITRFYGPHFNRLGGAHMDFGNAYMQQAHIDIEPIPGQLVIFPSWLPHQAMPYAGEQDRIIVSFNASIHSDTGTNQIQPYARS